MRIRRARTPGEAKEGREVDGRRLVPGRMRVRQVFGRRERGMKDGASSPSSRI